MTTIRILSLCLLIFIGLLLPACMHAQQNAAAHMADKPLFRDPVYDGAADPVVIWNRKQQQWFMFYTNRRANVKKARGVTWVHGTRIGIAVSKNGASWQYLDTAHIDHRPDSGYTYWAPEVIEHEGLYHMYLTYVPGTFTNWNHPRSIIHLISSDLLNWKYVSTLDLANDQVIDACVFRLPGGGWRMWYNNEKDHKSFYYADSPDLYHWQDKGPAIRHRPGEMSGEGPKVFRWKDRYWMIVDNWAGLGVYSSADLLHWQRQQERLLEHPGQGADDQAIGGHADVVVNDGRAYLFYFTHPGRAKAHPAPDTTVAWRRSVIQLAELKYQDGRITCNRDEPVKIKLIPPGSE
ncbi:family 43 glycosylhydrolase [Chitinophaga japonensis]|uniref:Glycosyl hydrolase family 43 n=1 Tax=Chitinophaga japonensis TaxID=104662 RepID=A0A562T4S3_CHIJA|nr:family 43 glycosylhydrolase [Chitinophaga japonensis]TWI88056.1 glycosyl hydrolase family 43 [Chitinophaga japonensis]